MAEKKLYDKDIREPLFDFLEEKYGKIRIFEEKQTGRARADVVMVTPTDLFGIEIKSDADTYTRLAGQVKEYNLYYDKNIIVVGTKHAMHVKDHVPETWGIITVELNEEGNPDFYCLREAGENPEVNALLKIQFLWRPELCHLLEKNMLPKYNYKSKAFVQGVLIENVPEDILWPQAYEELFERDYTTIGQKINEYRQSIGQKKRKRRTYRRKTAARKNAESKVAKPKTTKTKTTTTKATKTVKTSKTTKSRTFKA